MSTIADYSILTKAFLASSGVDFTYPYTNQGTEGFRAFAVVPLFIDPTLTTQKALNLTSWEYGDIRNLISCRDAEGNFIGNIVRIQPDDRKGSIRLVAKVAVPAANESDVAGLLANTFVLLRMNSSATEVLPIAVATISAGYKIHKNPASGNDPLDAVDNANYVSFTINNLNGYTSVDFNPDAYATYDDVANALSRGIDGLHIAFNSNTGDIILSDSKGNVIDQANLHLDLSADTIIAEGEEGYKYVKTDRNQDVHSAKAFMAPSPSEETGSYDSAFADAGAINWDTKHASLVRTPFGKDNMCNGIRVKWTEGADTPRDDIFCILWKEGDEKDGTDPNKKYLSCCIYSVGDGGSVSMPSSIMRFKTASKTMVEWPGSESGSKIFSDVPKFEVNRSIYSHDVFVHTVGNSSLADWDECFKLMGFHDGDDIPLGTLLLDRISMLTSGDIDPEEFIHGATYNNAEKVAEQRKFAKEEMVAYNSRRPALAKTDKQGTIIDHKGLDVRNGSIILGCGRTGQDGAPQKVNYGIQMKDRTESSPIRNRSESLDFTISQTHGEVTFDGNGHAKDLTSSTLLSIESGSYISGAPTCLILAKVTCNTGDGTPKFNLVRMTAGFDVTSDYLTLGGLSLTIHDYRDNIISLLNPNLDITSAPAIIEIQALYTHLNAETVPAQQMHTYIGKWMYNSDGGVLMNHPECSFLCNKIEDWMTSVGLTDIQNKDSELYVVIRVY